MTKLISSVRLYEYNTPGSMGVVADTHYKGCYWPKLDKPTALFAEGSSGLVIEGPPTPRNVLFPLDTQFLNGTRGDCFFLRHTEVVLQENGKARFDDYVAELTSKEADDLRHAKVAADDLMAEKEFVPISESPLTATKAYQVTKVGGKATIVEKVAEDVSPVKVVKL